MNPTNLIRRARVPATDSSSLQARRRFERAFDASAEASALPQDAILCIRRIQLTGSAFSTPRPFEGGAAGNVGGASKMLAAELQRLANSAARPALGFVPAGAEAVLFRDTSEMLASLARDWTTGESGMCWWWRCLFPSTELAQAVRSAWRTSPESVPAALDSLATNGIASAFLARLHLGDVRSILGAVVEKFGLADLNSALAPMNAGPAPLDSHSFRVAPSPNPGTPAGCREPKPPTWERWVAADQSLTQDSRCLWIVCTVLIRAPGFAQSTAFASELKDWLMDGMDGMDAAPSGESMDPIASSDSRTSTRPTMTESFRSSEVGERPPSWDDLGDSATFAASTPAPTANNLGASAVEPADQMPRFMTQAPEGPRAAEASTPAGFAGARPVPGANAVEPAPQTDTAWGGLFYLINLALHLELYGDFTTPAQPGLALPAWDFLALLGRRWIGPPLETDPLWNLLRDLGGRAPDEPPGQWFDPPREWRMPASWLEPFEAADDWSWSAADGRLRVRHPRGFPALDVALDHSDPIAQLNDKLAACPLNRQQPDPMNRWLDWLAPYVEARLTLALDVSGWEAARDLILPRRARVETHGDRVDVRFMLAEHPIALRLAGLDRDPGWVPAARRTLAFHYD